jgi:hypothetical protein
VGKVHVGSVCLPLLSVVTSSTTGYSFNDDYTTKDAGVWVQQCAAVALSGHGSSGRLAPGQHDGQQTRLLHHGQAAHHRLPTVLAVHDVATGVYEFNRRLVCSHDTVSTACHRETLGVAQVCRE